MDSQYLIKSQSRISYTKKYPNNGVKCSVCQCIYSINQIQKHMASHIYPSYLVPNTKINNNNLKKMTKPKIYFEQKENDFINAAVNSIKVDQFPKYQNLRNQKYIPQQYNSTVQTQTNDKRINFNNLSKNKVEKRDSETNLNIINIQYQMFSKQCISQIVNVGTENHNFHKRNVQTYQSKRKENQKNSSNYTNNLNSQIKIQKYNQNVNYNIDQSNTAYIIQVEQQPLFNQILRIQKENQKKKDQKIVQIPVQVYKPANLKNQSISTKSKQQKTLQKSQSTFSFFTSLFTCYNLTNTEQNQIKINMNNYSSTGQSFGKSKGSQKDIMLRGSHQHNNQCKDCGGFYCNTCHSTIPPQYRIYNMGKVDQKTMSFYKNVVYNQKNCEKCN